MIKEVNMEERHLREIARIYHALKNCIRVDIIPYHPYGSSKYNQLGLQYEDHVDWIPNQKDLKDIKDYLINQNVVVS